MKYSNENRLFTEEVFGYSIFSRDCADLYKAHTLKYDINLDATKKDINRKKSTAPYSAVIVV